MLIDAKQKKWFAAFVLLSAAALAGWWYINRTIPGGLRGGDTVGLWFGSLGSVLMIYAGLLAAHRKVPSWWWLGARKTWLRGHVWMGLLSVVLILCHSSFHWGGPLEKTLWWVLIGVIVTGILGVILQNILPRLLTSRVPTEAPYEQIPHLCREMRRKADAIIDEVCGAYDPSPPILENTIAVVQYASNAKAQLRDFYENEVRPFFDAKVSRRSPLFNPLQAEARFTKLRRLPGLDDATHQVDDLARYCEERRLMAEQERIHFWLHAWLLVHIPLSVALLVLGVTHVVTALRY
ncbi:MAG: hypothetical protein HYS12_10780 [Planctomycetes bacterium]|nr:hypothetical protein [Planctomycetota bacterium]